MLSQTRKKANFQRAQCAWLGVVLNLSPADAATAVGMKQSTVKISSCMGTNEKDPQNISLTKVGGSFRRGTDIGILPLKLTKS